MADILMKRAHHLGREEAKRSVDAIADKLKGELGASYRWAGDSLHFECPGAKGKIDVAPAEVTVAVHLSWLLSGAKGKVERSIEEYLKQYLA